MFDYFTHNGQSFLKIANHGAVRAQYTGVYGRNLVAVAVAAHPGDRRGVVTIGPSGGPAYISGKAAARHIRDDQQVFFFFKHGGLPEGIADGDVKQIDFFARNCRTVGYSDESLDAFIRGRGGIETTVRDNGQRKVRQTFVEMKR